MIHLILPLLTVPPVPPPPPDRVAAATELLRAAPVPRALGAQLLDRAISIYASGVGMSEGKVQDYAVTSAVRKRIADRVADDADFTARFDGCMVEEIGWAYDLPTLNAIASVVTTPGGQVLWNASLPGSVEQCYGRALPEFLQTTGFAGAIRWLVRTKPKAVLPHYDAAGGGVSRLAAGLARVCGPSTRVALVERGGRLGIEAGWASRQRNAAALACLVQSATLARYDLGIFERDGSTAKVIIAS